MNTVQTKKFTASQYLTKAKNSTSKSPTRGKIINKPVLYGKKDKEEIPALIHIPSNSILENDTDLE